MEQKERMVWLKAILSIYEYHYTHSKIISSMNAMDKVISKKIFIQNQVLTPKFFVLKKKFFQLRFKKKLVH